MHKLVAQRGMPGACRDARTSWWRGGACACRDARTNWWRSGACLARAGTHAQVGGAAGRARGAHSGLLWHADLRGMATTRGGTRLWVVANKRPAASVAAQPHAD